MTCLIDNTQILRILGGGPGSGKTAMMLDEIAAHPGRYILAAPRQDLIEEHVNWLQALAASHGTTPTLQPIHSRQGAREPVGRRINEGLATHHANPHIVLAITHEALLALDGAVLAGWHVRIDELPDGAVSSGQVSICTSWPALAAHYALEPSGVPGRSLVRPRSDVEGLSLTAIISDVSEDLVSLHRAIATPTRPVVIDIKEWGDASMAGRRINWWSLWSPDVLVGCASLVLTSASYVGSLLQRVLGSSERITVSLEDVSTAVQTEDSSIRIHYYTQHPGSTSWWQTEEGSRCLVQVSRHLESIRFAGYWSSNQATKPFFWHRFAKATSCAPKQAGSNALRRHTACAIVYSGKAQGNDESIINVLGLDRNDIRSTREDEDIYQFVMRGAIRDAAFGGGYDIYVYDLSQAERLRDRLAKRNGATLTLVPVDEAGIMDVVRPQPAFEKAGSSASLSLTEQREQQRQKECERGQRRRMMERDRRRAEGTLREPGRPKGSQGPSPLS